MISSRSDAPLPTPNFKLQTLNFKLSHPTPPISGVVLFRGGVCARYDKYKFRAKIPVAIIARNMTNANFALDVVSGI